MTTVYWLPQDEHGIPEHHGWLTPAEAAVQEGLRSPRRRRAWRLRTWTAKHAVAAALELPAAALRRVEVRERGKTGMAAFVDGRPSGVTVALGQHSGHGVCAVAPGDVVLGADLQHPAPRAKTTAAEQLTVSERRRVAEAPEDDRAAIVHLLRSAKASALRARRPGGHLEARHLEVALPALRRDEAWHPLFVRHTVDEWTFAGWWRWYGRHLLTVVAAPAPHRPVRLRPPATDGRDTGT